MRQPSCRTPCHPAKYERIWKSHRPDDITQSRQDYADAKHASWGSEEHRQQERHLHQVSPTPSPRNPLCPPLRISTYRDIQIGGDASFTIDRTRTRAASSVPNRPEGCLWSSWRIQDPLLRHHPPQTSPHRYHVPAATTTPWTTRKWKESKSKSRIRIHPPLVAPLCMHKDDSLLLLPESSRDG